MTWEADYTTVLSPMSSSSSQGHPYEEENMPEMYSKRLPEDAPNTTEPDPRSTIAVMKSDSIWS